MENLGLVPKNGTWGFVEARTLDDIRMITKLQ